VSDARPPLVDIPDDYVLRIGKINVAWGALETIVDLVLARLAGFEENDPRGPIIFTHMTWPLKMDILGALVHAHGPAQPSAAEFASAKRLFAAAQRRRNNTSHGMWAYDDGKVFKATVTARGELKASLDPISLADLDQTIAAIHRASNAAWDLITVAPDSSEG
jgi:hypothetical protein